MWFAEFPTEVPEVIFCILRLLSCDAIYNCGLFYGAGVKKQALKHKFDRQKPADKQSAEYDEHKSQALFDEVTDGFAKPI